MLNLLFIGVGICLIVIRIFSDRSFLPMPDFSTGTMDYLLSGLTLFNNITTFSLLSFLDHFFSHPSLSPVPSLYLIPFYSVTGPSYESLRHLFGASVFITVLFLGIWLWEIKKTGRVISSKSIRGSSLFLCFALIAESLLIENWAERPAVTLLCVVSSLYLLRLLNNRTVASRSFSFVLFLLALCNLWLGAFLFTVFLGLELAVGTEDQRARFVTALKSLLGWKRLPFLSGLFYVGFLGFLLVTVRPTSLPVNSYQMAYLAFGLLFIRGFILYRGSFLSLVTVSWNHRQVLYFFLFPLALWLLYPNPNRFEFLANSFAKEEEVKVEEGFKAKFEASLPRLMLHIASDRRILFYGISKQDPKCLALEFELKRKFPDWSRNPEPEVCPLEPLKIDLRALGDLYLKRDLSTLVALHSQASNAPFELSMFLRESNVPYERTLIHLKEWNLYATVFYVAQNE